KLLAAGAVNELQANKPGICIDRDNDRPTGKRNPESTNLLALQVGRLAGGRQFGPYPEGAGGCLFGTGFALSLRLLPQSGLLGVDPRQLSLCERGFIKFNLERLVAVSLPVAIAANNNGLATVQAQFVQYIPPAALAALIVVDAT